MQSKTESLIESMANTISGFIVSLLLWSYVVVPVWHLQVSTQENLVITALFTVVSVARSYVWRRYFNVLLRQRLKPTRQL